MLSYAPTQERGLIDERQNGGKQGKAHAATRPVALPKTLRYPGRPGPKATLASVRPPMGDGVMVTQRFLVPLF